MFEVLFENMKSCSDFKSTFSLLVFFIFSSLQKQHDSFRDWLQTKEKQCVVSDKVKILYKELQDER